MSFSSVPASLRSTVFRIPPRLTLLFLRYPGWYVEPEAAGHVDVDRWSAAFEWEQDAWNGLRDTVDPVETVLETATGDCDDYAVVVASWAVANDRDPSLIVCKSGSNPLPLHVAVWDGERVYSSGEIYEAGPDEYLDESEYDRYRLQDVG